MTLIIDGYNLLHVAGIFGRGKKGGSLQRSREALLRFLAASLDPAERPVTTIVFDAADAPPGLPRQVMVDEMTVLYAANYADADALIEELIAADHSPRALLVVSSDHRIQRAARRRRARFIDSDLWHVELVRKRQRRERARPRAIRPTGTLSPTDVAYWVEQFQGAEPGGEPPADRPGADRQGTAGPRADPRVDDVPAADLPTDKLPADDSPLDELPIDNPFPPGYGEDLL